MPALPGGKERLGGARGFDDGWDLHPAPAGRAFDPVAGDWQGRKQCCPATFASEFQLRFRDADRLPAVHAGDGPADTGLVNCQTFPAFAFELDVRHLSPCLRVLFRRRPPAPVSLPCAHALFAVLDILHDRRVCCFLGEFADQHIESLF